MTYRRARYRSGASGASPVPVDESLGLVDDYLTRPAAELGLLMMGHCTAREAAAFFAKTGAPGGGDLTGGQVRPPLAPDHFRQRANRLYVVRIASPGACTARRIRRPAENPRFRREIIQPILQYPAGSSERARAIEEAAWIVRVLPNGRSGRVADSPRNRRSWNGDRMVLPAHKQHLP